MNRVYRTFKVSDYVSPTSQMKVRFSATDNPNNSVTEAGIDAFKVVVVECEALPFVSIDLVPDDQVLAASLRGGTIKESQKESQVTYSTGPVTLYAWPGEINGTTSPFWNEIFQFSSSFMQMLIDNRL